MYVDVVMFGFFKSVYVCLWGPPNGTVKSCRCGYSKNDALFRSALSKTCKQMHHVMSWSAWKHWRPQHTMSSFTPRYQRKTQIVPKNASTSFAYLCFNFHQLWNSWQLDPVARDVQGASDGKAVPWILKVIFTWHHGFVVPACRSYEATTKKPQTSKSRPNHRFWGRFFYGSY